VHLTPQGLGRAQLDGDAVKATGSRALSSPRDCVLWFSTRDAFLREGSFLTSETSASMRSASHFLANSNHNLG